MSYACHPPTNFTHFPVRLDSCYLYMDHRIERVRRLFAQYLRGKPDVPASATAREALEKEKTLPEKQASVFAELYDRARYSDHPVSEARRIA